MTTQTKNISTPIRKLSQLNFLKREALSNVLLAMLEKEPYQSDPNMFVKIQKKCIEIFGNTENIEDEHVENFLKHYNIPLGDWYKELRLLLDPYIKEYLKWLPSEQEIKITHEFFNTSIPITEWLRNSPEFIEYLNLDIKDVK